MSNLKKSPEEIKAERQRLHLLIQKRAKKSLAGVKKMEENPYTIEQKLAQKARIEEQIRLDENRRG